MDWRLIQAVVFDVDGTLFDLKPMRRRMLGELAGFYVRHPHRLKELVALFEFRRQRERHRSARALDLEREQYQWPAGTLGVSEQTVRAVVEHWVFSAPLKHLPACRFPGVADFFAALSARRIAIVALSDYPPERKLLALGLQADLALCSTDRAINRFKPDPAGLRLVMNTLGLAPNQVLVIGDRQECEGLAAQRAGMPCVLVASGDSRFYPGLNEQLARAWPDPGRRPKRWPVR